MLLKNGISNFGRIKLCFKDTKGGYYSVEIHNQCYKITSHFIKINYHLSNVLYHHWKRPWCWERLKANGEGGGRG